MWAAAIVLISGLALIGLGGCFLIGVMAMYTNSFAGALKEPVFGTGGYVLIGILYVLALACFIGAFLAIIAGIRGLTFIIRAGFH